MRGQVAAQQLGKLFAQLHVDRESFTGAQGVWLQAVKREHLQQFPDAPPMLQARKQHGPFQESSRDLTASRFERTFMLK